jgi:outer membrane protein insertion porin family
MTDEKATQAIKALFATGFFKDVRLEIDNNVLVVVIDERPAIASVSYTGVKALDVAQLSKGMKDVGLGESRIFDRSILDRAEKEIKRVYLSRGYYAASVTTTVTPLERNRVGISFNVEEGEIAKIKQISIIGANAFPESELLQQFILTTSGWLTWYSKHSANPLGANNESYSTNASDFESKLSTYLIYPLTKKL